MMGLFTEHDWLDDRIGELEKENRQLKITLKESHKAAKIGSDLLLKRLDRKSDEIEQLRSDLAAANEDECKFRELWGKAKNDLEAANEDGCKFRKSAREYIERLRKEIAIDDELLADRKRVLDLFACPAHGECVPFAIEEIKRLQKDNYDLLVTLRMYKGMKMYGLTGDEKKAIIRGLELCDKIELEGQSE